MVEYPFKWTTDEVRGISLRCIRDIDKLILAWRENNTPLDVILYTLLVQLKLIKSAAEKILDKEKISDIERDSDKYVEFIGVLINENGEGVQKIMQGLQRKQAEYFG